MNRLSLAALRLLWFAPGYRGSHVLQSLKEDLVAKKTTKKKTTTNASTKKRNAVSNAQPQNKIIKKTTETTDSDAVTHKKTTAKKKKRKSTKNLSNAKTTRQKKKTVAKPDTKKKRKKRRPTPLKAETLHYYQELLLLRRADLVGDVQSLEAGALRSSNSGNLSNVPQHMADVGSDTYEQDFNLSLAASEREMLNQIDDALLRIDDKTFGICLESGKRISKARLDAKPWARYTIEIARERERKDGW